MEVEMTHAHKYNMLLLSSGRDQDPDHTWMGDMLKMVIS
jgi:hypothetical protein